MGRNKESSGSHRQTPSHGTAGAEALLPPPVASGRFPFATVTLASGATSATRMDYCLSLTFSSKFAVCSVAQSCLTLCDPMGCSPPGSSVHGISQARILPVACRFLLQAIFLSLCLLHHRRILCHCATWEAFELPGGLEMRASDSLSLKAGD